MRFWQSITWAETDQLCDIARLAEELGFEGIIGADHALYPKALQPGYPYSESGILVSPKPSHPIPIYFGGAAPVALRRTARIGDGWIGAGNTPEEVPRVLGEIARLRAQAGRVGQLFDSVVGVYAEPSVDLFRRLEGAGMTSGIHLPFSFAFDGPSTLDQKKRLMEGFAEDVIRHFE